MVKSSSQVPNLEIVLELTECLMRMVAPWKPFDGLNVYFRMMQPKKNSHNSTYYRTFPENVKTKLFTHKIKELGLE
jgi:hypothetical protein